MKRFLSWIIVGLSVMGCPFVVYAGYQMYLFLITLTYEHVPIAARAITTLSEWLEQFEFIETGFSGLIATGIVLLFAWICIRVSTKLSPSVFGLRFYVAGWIGFLLALAALVRLGIYVFSLHLSFMDTIRFIAGDVYTKTMFFTIVAEIVLCAYLEQQYDVPFRVMIGGKARTLFCAIPDSTDKPLKYLAYFSGKEGLYQKDGSLRADKLESFLRKVEEKYPAIRDYLVFSGCAISAYSMKSEDVIQIHGEVENQKVQYYLNPDTPLCKVFKIAAKEAAFSLKDVPEIKTV